MDVTGWVAALRAAGEELATNAAKAGFDTAVPSCPDWRVRDLVLHTGEVHRWAGMYIATGHAERVSHAEARGSEDSLPGDEALLSWFTEGVDALASALSAAPADLTCWTFLEASSPLEHWARRQAHETTMHRLDTEAAAGTVSPVDPELAADGVDELLACFGTRSRRLRTDVEHTLRVHAADTGDEWAMRLHTDRPVVTRSRAETAEAAGEDGTAPVRTPGPKHETVLRGTAEQLYRALWNRAPLPPLHIRGDATLVNEWPSLLRVR